MGRTIEITAGEEHVEVFTVLDAAVSAQDLTGAFCYFGVWRLSTNLQIFQRDNDLAQSNAGIVLTDAVGGIVTLTIARANTSSEAAQGVNIDAAYQFWVRLAPAGADDPIVTQAGRFVIKPSYVTFV